MAFSSLNRDALSAIFIRLPVTDRLRFETVCKQWGAIMPYNDMKSLHLSDFGFDNARHDTFFENMGHWTMNYAILAQQPLQKFFEIWISRCGKFLENLDLSVQNGGQFRVLIDSGLLEFIGSNAREIKQLNLGYSFVRVNALQTLITYFPNLHKLNLSLVMFADEEANRPTRYLSQIKEPLEMLINSHPRLNDTCLVNLRFVLNLENPQIGALRTPKCHHIRDEDLERIFSDCPNIELVDLSGCSKLENPAAGLINLDNLRHLNLADTALCDGGLAKICRYCPKIATLDIQRCLTLREFYPLLLLEKLSGLKIGPASNFSDDILFQIATRKNLQSLEIVHCPITDISMAVVAKNPLGHLKLSGTKGIHCLPDLIRESPALKRLMLYDSIDKTILTEVAELSRLKVFDFRGYFDFKWIRSLAERRRIRMLDGETFVKLFMGYIWSQEPTSGTNEFQELMKTGNIGKLSAENFD